MKILLSAYACEPNKGSEPGVGWHWALELARLDHQVWVITRANNQAVIEAALSVAPQSNLNFAYVDLPFWITRWKKLPGGVYWYYFLWQIKAYLVAKPLAKQINFDWVHHITFGVLRLPSFMAFLGIPFIFGPLGGGETSPKPLRSSFPLRGYILDWLRDFTNKLILVDPLLHSVYRRSSIILCKTEETKATIPHPYQHKCRLYLEIGIESRKKERSPAIDPTKSEHEFRLLYVGRLVYWKGLHLGLQAFARFQQQNPNSRLTIIGKGSDRQWLEQMAQELGIAASVDWIDWMPQQQVMNFYTQHDVFLFPSLHDSSGNVVLEALSHALPVVCLDLGGPGMMIDSSCGRAIDTRNSTTDTVVAQLALALQQLAGDRQLLAELSRGAVLCSQNYQWHKLVDNFYNTLETKYNTYELS